jgi:hypothetical protein
MKTLKELIAQTKTSHPINGHFKVTVYKPYSLEIARTGTSTNTSAWDRIHSQASPRSIADGYTLRQAYVALYNDTHRTS